MRRCRLLCGCSRHNDICRGAFGAAAVYDEGSRDIRILEADGWVLVAMRGSHRQFKHATKPGRVTVAGKPTDDVAPGTSNSIMKQAGMKEQN